MERKKNFNAVKLPRQNLIANGRNIVSVYLHALGIIINTYLFVNNNVDVTVLRN